MTKQDFLESLRRTLNGNMAPVTVDEHIRFYDGYIVSEIAKGKSEAEIVAGLGDPRILARTLIDAAERAGDEYAQQNAQRSTESGSEECRKPNASYESSGALKRVQMPGWLMVLLVIVVMLFVIRVIGTIFFALLPYMIPVVIVVYIIKLIRRE